MSSLKTHDTQQLDALTGGAFSAPTSGERAARVRDWLATQPSTEQMQEVFRELSGRDKGAARLLREKLDEIKRAKGQEAIAAEWSERARNLLAQPRLNIADAMAWQRDAAKAGAPLSREPLASVKTQLADRIKGIEDLQNRVQVQREAAVLLAQRIEVLSTKSWRDAQAAVDALRADVPQWQGQAQGLLDDANWVSVDPKFPPLLEASRNQLQVVWDAFQTALAQAIAASEDANAPLPPVPVWADELRQARGLPAEAAPAAKPAKPKVDPELRAKANQAVGEVLAKLEAEIAQGHGKASVGAANALRNALKEHGKLVDDKLETQAHNALAAATELEGWQRWRADQLRQELVAKAEALFETVPAPAAAGARPPRVRKARAEAEGQAAPAADGQGAAQGGDAAQGAEGPAAAAQPAPEVAAATDLQALHASDVQGGDEAHPGGETQSGSEAQSGVEAQAAAGAAQVAGEAQSADQAQAAAEGQSAGHAQAAAGAQPAGEGEADRAGEAQAADRVEVAAEAPLEGVAAAQAEGQRVDEAQAADQVEAAAEAQPAGADAQADAAASQPAAETRRPREARAASAPAPAPQRKPRYGGRKMQETLRSLREQWKQVDQSGPPNHALWKRFDEACNEAYKVVQEWLDKVKSEAAEHRSARLALINEVKAWADAHPQPERGDWKAFNRALHQFSDRWREAGHLSEKAFAELQPQWKEAIGRAAAPLDQAQKASIERRNAMIEEAKALGEAPMLRIDAVKSLQQRWQAEAQSVPLDRKQEQKLWDTFRKPIDDAFNRKTAEREKAAAAMSGRDRAVLEASRAVEEATASGDAQKIRAALAALEQALRARDDEAAAARPAGAARAAAPAADAAAATPATEGDASESAGGPAGEATGGEGAEAAAPAAAPKPPAKPVVAVRGDDRPGARRAEPVAAGRGGRFGDTRRPGGPGGPGGRDDRRGGGFGERRFGDRDRDAGREDRGPRLGDTAFRAQRDALEHAQATLRKLAAQAHGEALTQLMTAWEQRSGEQVPAHQDLKAVSTGVRQQWVQALGQPARGDAAEALLRLEIAADVPTPAEQITARRALQLQLLTRRHDPSPQETWGQDVAKVLATGYDGGNARRLQNALKALLRR